MIFINDFQLKYHEASNHFEVYTGIPVPVLYEAQPADFNILLNYLPLDHPSHLKNTVLNPSSLVHSSMSAQSNGPSLGNSPQLVPSTVNHFLNATKDNTNMIAFVNRSISNAEQNNVHNSVSIALMPSHPQDSDTTILRCTLGNSQYQESYQTRLSNPFHTTYKECRL